MKKKILKFSIEALLIVFSILLAFWIESRKDASADREIKARLYNRIYIDLKSDSANFASYLKRRSRAEKELDALIRYANGGKITIDSLTALLQYVEWFASYSPSHSTYNSIVSSGKMHLFERDTIFLDLSDYVQRNIHVASMSEAYTVGANRFMVPYLNEHFDRRWFYNRDHASAIDLKKFISREFLNVCYSLSDRLIDRSFLEAHAKKQAVLLTHMRAIGMDEVK